MKLMRYILKYKKRFFIVIPLMVILSCIEEIPLESDGFEEALVIEGTVTNEVKHHEIRLSKVFAIDSTGPKPLTGANVSLSGNKEYVFEEAEPGVYISLDSFAAQPAIEYELNILVNNKEYKSQSMQLPGNSKIGKLQANRIDYGGENGVAITLNNQNIDQTANYYRYEYVETFKFNSNYKKVKDLIIVNEEPIEVPKQKEEYTCYQTNKSQEIILANTNSLSEDVVNNLLIKFISSDSPILSNRYSILVKQYVISREAYTYYEILEELSGLENVFTQSQPGFFAGNISNINKPEEKVIGYFDISSVSTKRVYFNYEDFYDANSIKPRFVSFAQCEVTTPSTSTLIAQLEQGIVRWSGVTPTGAFMVVPTRCVDCTVFGSNKKPEFWED